MSSHRFWRLIGIKPAGGNGVELSEVQLLDDVLRVDAGVALTCSKVPASGAIGDLQDDATAGAAVWGDWRGLSFTWDMGVAIKVNNFLFGSGASRASFPLAAALEWSDDGSTWHPEVAAETILWPGPGTKTASESRYRWSRSVDETRKIGNQNDDYVTGEGDTKWVARGYHRALLRDASRSSGVLQIEFVADVYPGGSGTNTVVGLLAPGSNLDTNFQSAGSRGYDCTGVKVTDAGQAAFGAAYAAGDVIGLKADFTAGTMTWYKNGVSQGVSHTDIAGLTLAPATGSRSFYASATSVRAAPPFLYPIAGAAPWFEGRFIKQSWFVPSPFEAGLAPVFPTPGVRPVPPPMVLEQTYRARKDYLYGGASLGIGRVRGKTLDHVDPANVPYRARVRLIREIDGMQMREAWAEADGGYDFQYVDELQTYTVLAYYLHNGKRAVVTDGLTLANGKVELML